MEDKRENIKAILLKTIDWACREGITDFYLNLSIDEILSCLKDKECEAKLAETARALFDEIICPMCYRLNPQHASMDYGKGCHSCQEKENWCGSLPDAGGE